MDVWSAKMPYSCDEIMAACPLPAGWAWHRAVPGRGRWEGYTAFVARQKNCGLVAEEMVVTMSNDLLGQMGTGSVPIMQLSIERRMRKRR